MAEYPTLTVGLRLPRMTLTLSSLGGQTVSQLGIPGAEGRPGRDGADGADGAPGPQGIPGVPAVWTGAYDPDRLYGANEAVVYQDPVTLIRASYVTTAPCQGVAPGPGVEPWLTIAMGTRGLDGAPGIPAGWWVSTRPPPLPVTFGQFLLNLGLSATASMAEITDAWRVVGPEVAGYYVWDDPTGLYLDPNFMQDAAALVGTVVFIPPAMQARFVASMDGAMQFVAPSLAISRPAPALDGAALAIPPALSLSQPASLGGGAAMGASSHVIVWFYQAAPVLDGASLFPPPALSLSMPAALGGAAALLAPTATANLPAPVMDGAASMAAPTFAQTGAPDTFATLDTNTWQTAAGNGGSVETGASGLRLNHNAATAYAIIALKNPITRAAVHSYALDFDIANAGFNKTVPILSLTTGAAWPAPFASSDTAGKRVFDLMAVKDGTGPALYLYRWDNTGTQQTTWNLNRAAAASGLVRWTFDTTATQWRIRGIKVSDSSVVVDSGWFNWSATLAAATNDWLQIGRPYNDSLPSDWQGQSGYFKRFAMT